MKKLTIAEKLGRDNLYSKACDEIEEVINEVNKILDEIIDNYSDSFKKDNYKVRPGYGYDKFYMNWVGGNYDMSLESLIFYILVDADFIQRILPKKYIEDLKIQIKEFPEGIYNAYWYENENMERDEQLNENADGALWGVIRGCIPHVAQVFNEKGYDIEPFVTAGYLEEEDVIDKKKYQKALKDKKKFDFIKIK